MGRGMPRPYYSCDPVTTLPFNTLAVSQEHSETSHRAFDVLHRVVAKHFDVDIRSFKHLQSLPNCFYASGSHTFGERHGYVIMWKERAELSQVIRGFTGHVRKDGIRIFLLQRCKFLSFGGE